MTRSLVRRLDDDDHFSVWCAPPRRRQRRVYDLADRRYSVGINAGLIALSQGTCYFPRCAIPVIVIVEKRPVLNLQRAHIVSAKRGGPRDVAHMDDEDRNSFDNLILLCNPHHLLVDKLERDRYPEDMLRQWKAEREALGIGALRGLGDLTEERLSEVIVDALDEKLAAVNRAVERLEHSDRETAQVLRGVLDGLNKYQVAGPYLDMDAISMLDRAARALSNSANMDVAGTLNMAADKLVNLPDTVALLASTVDRMPREYG
jgi:hypothetical protein